MEDIQTEIKRLTRLIDVAYCAGLIDGEGCFYVHHAEKTQQFLMHLIVMMGDREPVVYLQKTFGGNVRPLNRAGKLHYRWVLCSENAALAIEELLQFLQGKKDEAELFLAYYQIWNLSKFKHHRDCSVLDAIEAKIRELKKIPWTEEILSAATTEREDSLESEGCDSLNSTDDKGGELPEMSNRLN